MPKPNAPPTPGSSSDLRGKEAAQPAPVFNLPPNALQEADRASTSSATPSANGSDSSYRPASPANPADLSRKRPASSSGPVVTKDDFALPPPPTRSRKIIQMKPREAATELDASASQTATFGGAQNTGKAQGGAAAPAGGRKGGRNNSNTTAAGRKIARKTAHSLIERRRRSKMNEEFGILKDMIPACKGQEMHKLAILQASIDYLRYLERCVADLQAQHTSPQPQRPPASVPSIPDDNDNDDEDEEMEDDDDEEQEEDGETAVSTPATNPQDRSGSLVSLPSLSQITASATTSPSVFSTGGRHYSMSSASQASYSPYFRSAQTSPAFGPQLSQITSAGPSLPAPYSTSRETFGLGSPAIQPLDSSSQHHLRKIAEGASEVPAQQQQQQQQQQRRGTKSSRSEQELDQEATAALLMLNHDRRNWRANKAGESGRSATGMSVRDLLSG